MSSKAQKQQSTLESVVNKAAGVILKNTTTGGAGQAERTIQKHMNKIDMINKELQNTTSQDTNHIKQIFEK